MRNHKITSIFILIFVGIILSFIGNLPNYVDHANNEGENLNSSALTCPYDWFYNKTWGTSYNDGPHSIASDSLGNIYIVGIYRDAGAVDPIYFLTKLNKKGEFLWNKTFSANDFRIAQIQVKEDKIYAIGNHGRNNDNRLTLHIYDIYGILLFNKTFYLAEPASIYALTIDSLNNIYVVGGWHWSYYPDGFICKINSTYSIEWYRTWVRSPNPTLKGCFRAVTLDNNEDIIVTGYAETLDPRDRSPLIVKYYKNGTSAWDKWWSGEIGKKVIIDSNNTIYHLSTDYTIPSYNYKDNKKVTKFTENGTLIWSKTLDYPDIQAYKYDDFILDSSEDLLVTGRIWTNGEEKIILLRYDKNGILLWNLTRDYKLNSMGVNEVYLTSDKYENICFTGTYEVNEANGWRDIFLHKIIINHKPFITGNSNNYTAGYGTIGHIISWHAIDFDGNYNNYWIERNEEQIFEGIWTYDMDIEFAETNDSLPLGVYNYTCFVKDAYGCVNHSSIFVTIAHIPYFSNIKIPNNSIYSPDAEYTFNCSWSDIDGVIQEVKLEFNSQHFTVTSNYSGEFSYTLKDLPANESGYNFRWLAMDNDGNWQNTDIFKFVLHKKNSELSLLFNSTSGDHITHMNNLVNITVYNLALFSGVFQLYLNQTLIQETAGSFLNNISQFQLGIYNVSVRFHNANYTGRATNFLYVVNNPYFVNLTSDFEIFEGDLYKGITWTPKSDLGYYDSFWIQKDGINVLNGTWDSSQIVYSDLSKLNAGIYNFTCFVNNTFGLQNWSTIIVSVLPNNNPMIENYTGDFTVNIGTVGYSLSWHVIDIDDNTLWYWIERNGVRIESGFWNNDTDIIFIETDDSLLVGLYNYTCFVNDTSGAMNCSSIFISIINHMPQILNNLGDFTVNIGTIGYSLSWHVIDIDDNTLWYWIERNGVRIESGFWDNDTDIIFIETDDSLLVGLYNYTCFVNDTSGTMNCSSIFVSIINHAPEIVNNITDFTVNNGTVGYSISWYVFDMDGNTDSYWIERNLVKINEGLWNSDTDIIFIEFDSLDIGIYNYTCFVTDSLGFINQSSIFVKVNSLPQYAGIVIPSITTYTLSINYIFNCSWIDDDGIISEVKFEFNNQNYTVLDNFHGEYTYTFKDLSANENGYVFRWHAKDDDGAWNTTEWHSFVLNKQYNELLILFNGTQKNLIDLFNPIINITIYNLNSTPGTLQLFVDSQLIQQTESYSLTNISQYLNGAYNITAILTDQNYTGYEMQWLNIQEISPPVIIFDFSEDYLNTTIPEYYHKRIRINCTVLDSSPLHWVYLCENSSGIFLNRSMIGLGNGDWVYEVDISHLNWKSGFCFFFFANDTWGNIGKNDNATYLYSVNVYDLQNPISTISYIPHDNPNMINISTSFRITGDDLGSGIFLIRYKINDSNWIHYIQPFNFWTYGPGTYEISYYSVDNAGNAEEIKSIIVVLIDAEEFAPQEAIPSFNLGILVTLILVITVIIIKYRKKHLKI